MTWPTLTMEVAFGSDATSTSPTFNDISDRLLDFESQRGRDMELDVTELGQLTATLRNSDRRFDPSNTGVLTNLITNPSFEVNTTGWSASNCTLVRDNAQARFGTWSGKLTVTVASLPNINLGGTFTPPTGVAQGTRYTLTAWVYASGGVIADNFYIQWYETGGATGDEFHSSPITPLSSGWNELTVSDTIIRTDRTAIGVFLVATGSSVGEIVYIDGVQLENGTKTDYIDGSLDNGRWAGTAHASYSYRGGPYYPNVIPVRQARLKANVLTVDYDVFRGDVVDWPQEWQVRQNTVPVTMADGFDALQIADFTTSRPIEFSGTRVGAILDAIGWPASMRSIDAGQSLIQAIDYEAANALQAMQDVAAAENGILFMSPTGDVVFHNRHRRLTDTTLQATFSNEPTGGELPLADAKLTYRRERLMNTIFVTQNGGDTFTSSDSTSQTKYRRRSPFTRTVYLSDPNDCQAMAEWFKDLYKDPVVRIEEVMLEPGMDDNLWAHALGRVIGDRIRVKVKPPGTGLDVIQSDVTIEGVGHRANGAMRRWQTTFRCSPSNTQTYWVLGTGELDDSSGTTTTRIAF